MRMRHGTVLRSWAGGAKVLVDGTTVRAKTRGHATVPYGSQATLLQEGRSFVIIGVIVE